MELGHDVMQIFTCLCESSVSFHLLHGKFTWDNYNLHSTINYHKLMAFALIHITFSLAYITKIFIESVTSFVLNIFKFFEPEIFYFKRFGIHFDIIVREHQTVVHFPPLSITNVKIQTLNVRYEQIFRQFVST